MLSTLKICASEHGSEASIALFGNQHLLPKTPGCKSEELSSDFAHHNRTEPAMLASADCLRD